MPPSISSAPFFQPGSSSFSRDSLKSAFAAHAVSIAAAERAVAAAERETVGDLEPHWVATIDAATD